MSGLEIIGAIAAVISAIVTGVIVYHYAPPRWRTHMLMAYGLVATIVLGMLYRGRGKGTRPIPPSNKPPLPSVPAVLRRSHARTDTEMEVTDEAIEEIERATDTGDLPTDATDDLAMRDR